MSTHEEDIYRKILTALVMRNGGEITIDDADTQSAQVRGDERLVVWYQGDKGQAVLKLVKRTSRYRG